MKSLQPILRRALILGALISISAAGLFGPALHELAHLGRDEGDPHACSCQFHTDQSEQSDSENSIAEDHDCAICRFLALSKQFETQPATQLATSEACERVCFEYFYQPAHNLRLTSAPRGPPVDC